MTWNSPRALGTWLLRSSVFWTRDACAVRRGFTGASAPFASREQAFANSPAQFPGSPDLTSAIMEAIIASHDAHNAMSTQALNSPGIRATIKDLRLNHAGLYESLRRAALGGSAHSTPTAP